MNHPRRIEREAVYAHSPERVWRALVDPAELAAWLMPNDFVAEPGHEFTLDTGEHVGKIQAEVLEIDEPRLLRCRWTGVFGDSVVTFELFPEGDGTRLRVVHDGFADPLPPVFDDFDEGWKQKLEEDLPRVLGSVN